MSILSKFSIAAANFDFEVKKIFRSLFEVATVAAAGSSNTDATALTAGKNLVTAADGTKGVILPVAEPEMSVTVVNTVAASDLKVYPAASAQINALTVTTGAFTIPGGQEATFHCDVALHWYVSTGSGASAAELEVLNGASATNATTGKAAILGTDGALALGGALTATTSIGIGSAVLTEAEMEMLDTLTGGTATASKALVVDANKSITGLGSVTSTAPTGGGIGYATGAGGAVTQLTNRSTGVTLSTLTGQITTHNASLAAEASADFVVTNTTVAIGDVVVVSIQSGSNGGGTIVSVSTVAAGSFTIRVHNGNVAAGTAETGAIIINFAVIKAVAA